MTNTAKLGTARQRLVAALEPARAGQPDPAGEAVRLAESRLIRGGREDLAYRLADAVDADGVTAAATRREMREVANKIDAELSPYVATRGFERASDGGERR